MVCPICNSPNETKASCSRCGNVFPQKPAASTSKKRSWQRRLGYQVLIHTLWLALPLYFYARLLRSGAYVTSLQIAASSPLVQGVLGEKIHANGLPIGSALPRYNSDFAEWSVSVKGSRGSGRLYGVANNIGGVWQFARLAVYPSPGGGKLDITPTPPRLQLTPEHRKTIYLVPLDLRPEQSLDWAPAYYKARFDADVELLAPVALTPLETDPSRHQLNADSCIDLIFLSHRDLANDPSAIIVGVTSRDMFISGYRSNYAENLREGDRIAVVSSARLEPTSFPGKWNKELLNSRLQKIITKNLAILYFDLPLSNDSTSLLSAGILNGNEVDYMSENIVGAEGSWDPFYNEGEPMVTIMASHGKPTTWAINGAGPLDLPMENFTADLALGLFMQEKMDFYLDGDYPLAFRRMYRNADDQSRPFGIGANDSLDTFLVGRMESYVDLVDEAGGRAHFVYANTVSGAEVYRSLGGVYKDARYERGVWRVTSKDGWTYLFPYRPKEPGTHVTVLTGMIDPKSEKFEMVRNNDGDLLSVTTPAGQWLHFKYDDKHRIRSITDSQGRTVGYEYDAGGRLIHVSASDGSSETYKYDDRNEMVSISDGEDSRPVLVNQYTSNSMLSKQMLADGRQLEYSYTFGTRNVIQRSLLKDPNGLFTFFDYGSNGYVQSLPTPPPQ
jgi:YD repeat-containing protein